MKIKSGGIPRYTKEENKRYCTQCKYLTLPDPMECDGEYVVAEYWTCSCREKYNGPLILNGWQTNCKNYIKRNGIPRYTSRSEVR